MTNVNRSSQTTLSPPSGSHRSIFVFSGFSTRMGTGEEGTRELWSLLGFDSASEDALVTALASVSDDEGHAPFPSQPRASSAPEVSDIVVRGGLREIWLAESVVVLPRSLSVSPALIRRMTDEVVWGGPDAADRTMETIGVGPNKRSELTRVEHFVSRHTGWAGLCNGFLAWIASALCGEDMVLCTSVRPTHAERIGHDLCRALYPSTGRRTHHAGTRESARLCLVPHFRENPATQYQHVSSCTKRVWKAVTRAYWTFLDRCMWHVMYYVLVTWELFVSC